MKELEVEFESNANHTGLMQFRQVKKGTNPKGKNVYIYQRTRAEGEHLGRVFGFEVFTPSITKAGTVQKFPNGTTRTIEEDTENYPGASVFGIYAYFCSSLGAAEKYFNEFMAEKDETEKTILIPVGEFTTNDLAEANQVQYITARNFILSAVELGTIKATRTERRDGARRPSQLFQKIA